MAKNTQRLEEITIGLPPELRAWIEREAERECRSVGGQIRFLVSEAARRNGASNGATPWPPVMELPKELGEARAEFAELSREFDALLALQSRGGRNKMGLLPHEADRFSFLRDRVDNLRNHIQMRERMQESGT